MINWFQTREPRERVLLMALAALLVFFVLWFAVTRERGPNGHTALEAAQIDRELWLRAAPQLNAAPAGGERAEFTRGALIDVARKRAVGLSRMQPESDGSLMVWIEDTQTTPLYGVIRDLTQAYNVDVETALISTNPSGTLSAQITLKPL